MSSLVYTKLGGGIHGAQPKGGLSGLTLEGGNSRSMTRLVLRTAFGNNGNMFTGNIRYVQDSSIFTRKKQLNTINNMYNAIKY
jgi:hypothetical protein